MGKKRLLWHIQFQIRNWGNREHDRGSSKTYLTIDRAPGAYLRKGYRRGWMNWRLWLSKKGIVWKKRIKNNKNLQRLISSQNREGSVLSFAIFEKIMYNRKISGLKADRREERRQVGLWIFDCQWLKIKYCPRKWFNRWRYSRWTVRNWMSILKKWRWKIR